MEGWHMSYMKSSASAERVGDPAALGNGSYQGTSSDLPSALTNFCHPSLRKPRRWAAPQQSSPNIRECASNNRGKL
jgi:hypothetical protein